MPRLSFAQLAWDIQGLKSHAKERNFFTKQTLHLFLGINQTTFIYTSFFHFYLEPALVINDEATVFKVMTELGLGYDKG